MPLGIVGAGYHIPTSRRSLSSYHTSLGLSCVPYDAMTYGYIPSYTESQSLSRLVTEVHLCEQRVQSRYMKV